MTKKLGQPTQYDPTNYPNAATDDLTSAEVGRDGPGSDPSAWPSAGWTVPEQYAGPVPSREYETSGLGRNLRDHPPVNTPATTDASSVMPSVVPPPGHTAQP